MEGPNESDAVDGTETSGSGYTAGGSSGCEGDARGDDSFSLASNDSMVLIQSARK